jgi:hypothetical protein
MLTMQEIDAILIRYADTASAAELSFRVQGALNPKQVLTRIDMLLEVPDRLTQLQQEQLLMLKLRQLIVNLEEMTLTPRVAEVLRGTIDSLFARLDKRVASSTQELNQLYAFQGVAMLESITEALNFMKGILSSEYDVPEDAWDNAMVQGIRHAQMKLASYEADARAETPAADAVEAKRAPITTTKGIDTVAGLNDRKPKESELRLAAAEAEKPWSESGDREMRD